MAGVLDNGITMCFFIIFLRSNHHIDACINIGVFVALEYFRAFSTRKESKKRMVSIEPS